MGQIRPLRILFIVLLIAGGAHYFWLLTRTSVNDVVETAATLSASKSHKYYCPMHPSVVSDKPDKCPICGMNLERMENDGKHEHEEAESQGKKKERKILYYRHPMGKNVTSPIPKKDEMGMDFIPVYEDETTSDAKETPVEGRVSFTIPNDAQQLIGVTTGTVSREDLIYEVKATGRVAYDPKLYEAIEEYRISAKTTSITRGLSKHFQEDSNSLIQAGKTKLKLLGFSDSQIEGLTKGTIDPKDFLLPQGRAWVYAEVFEYELSFLKVGQEVEVTVPSLPQERFTGKVVSVNPIIDPSSRTLRIRTEISDPSQTLKPDMYVNTYIKVHLGEELVIPDSAVIHTGQKALVFIVSDNRRFEPREVTLGPKSKDKYAVLAGLSEGETVVTSANFLIDSESRLRSVVASTGQSKNTTHAEH